MPTDTSKITTAANELGDGLTKGGTAAKTLGAEIAGAINMLDAAVTALDSRVDKLEAGTIEPEPPDPEPPTNTHGKIENFSGISGNTSMKIDAKATKNLNVNATSTNSWSIIKVDDYTMKYEVRSGDRARAANGWVDSAGVERSETEMMPRYSPGKTITVEYGFIMHPGPAITAQWMVIGQCHFDGTSGGSPPVAMSMWGEKMGCVLRGPNNAENRVWTDTQNIQRGKKYDMKLEIMIGASGSGTVKIWRDGTQIVNYSGALGTGQSNATHYWKQGLYREAAAEATAVTYSNHHVTVA